MLQMRQVSKGYGAEPQRTEVLKGIDLAVEDGEFLAILGFSGRTLPRRPSRTLRGLGDGREPEGVRRARLLDGRFRGRWRRDHPAGGRVRWHLPQAGGARQPSRRAVLFGDTADSLWYRDLALLAAPIAPLRDALAFGKAHAEAA
jgi:hypothetical protein